MPGLLRTAAVGVCALIGLTGCKGDQEISALSRQLSTSLATFDAGIVPVEARETLSIFLASTGAGEVRVSDVWVDDPEHWEVTGSWQLNDGVVPGGTPTSPGYGKVDVVFKPDTIGPFRTILTIASDDSEVQERDDDGRGIWRVVLRGIGRDPCGQLVPDYHDFGPRPPGGYFSTQVAVENCGNLTLTIADFDVEGSPSFSVQTPTPIYVLPGDTETIEVAFEPGGGAPEAEAWVSIDSDAPDLVATDILVRGNACDGSGHPAWDSDGDGWTVCGGDCDDTDDAVHPGASERPGNGIDDDCDGDESEPPDVATDDRDEDGVTVGEGDCLDSDPTIFPGAVETPNQVDDDCDGDIDEDTELADDDGDGWSEVQGDCDDDERLIAPGIAEDQNGIDDDCDGLIDEGTFLFDDDGDGVADIEGGVEADCNDADPWVLPGGAEDCDGVDNDCDGVVDEGEDGTPDGACAFIVDRQRADARVAAAQEEGCSTLGGLGMTAAWLPALLVATRRRR